MGFARVCAEGDIGIGEMEAFFVDDWEVLVVRDSKGTLRAMDGTCPHEDFPLVHGMLDEDVLVCANHSWCFDATTGKGINPPSCKLDLYDLKVEDGEVFVDTESSPSQVAS
jgi:toluene monooxygenase system ferredoxin subunit